jgi:hypothetical protein
MFTRMTASPAIQNPQTCERLSDIYLVRLILDSGLSGRR